MKIVSYLHIFSFVISITYPFFTWGGVFSAALCQNTVVDANIGITTPSVIFKKHLGATNPNQWARQLSKPVNPETVLASSGWKNYQKDILSTYGKTNSTRQYLDYQKYNLIKNIKINNISHARSLDIKGNLAESVMDAFYSKDGWEKLDGKRGRNGFDGLYVRRNQKGTIIDWVVADAKSGNAKLRMTNRGMQLSPEWIRGNLKDLLTNAENAYKQTPTKVGRKRISDLKQIMRLPGRTPRVFNAKLGQFGGKIQSRLENIDINGNRIGKPMFVDMGKEGPRQRMIYKNLEKSIAIYKPKEAASLVSKLKINIKNGSIKNDSDLYRFTKRAIPNKQLARIVMQKLGIKPPKRTSTNIIGKKINVHSGTGARIGGSLLVGLGTYYIWRTIDNYNKGRMTQTDMIVNVSSGVAIAGSEFLSCTKTGKSLVKCIPRGAGIAGGSLLVGLEIYYIGRTVYNYNKGRITQTDMIVDVGSEVAIAGSGYLSYTIGESLGALTLPAGISISVGSVIGIGIVGLVAGGRTVYHWYTECQRREFLVAIEHHRANWESKDKEIRFNKLLQQLEFNFLSKRESAWQKLIPVN